MIFSIQVVSKGFVTVGGYSTFRVVTGSMEPTISTGALLICKNTPIEKIEEGEIICYRSEAEEIYGSIVTHRVVAVYEKDGVTYMDVYIHADCVGKGNLHTDFSRGM